MSWCNIPGFSSEPLVGKRPTLPVHLLDSVYAIKDSHASVEGEEEVSGTAEADDVDSKACDSGAHKISQGKGRKPNSCQMEK